MYACIYESGRGFFEGVCTHSNATANSRDPPPPRNTKEPEPCQCGSGSKGITRCATVGGAFLEQNRVAAPLLHQGPGCTPGPLSCSTFCLQIKDFLMWAIVD